MFSYTRSVFRIDIAVISWVCEGVYIDFYCYFFYSKYLLYQCRRYGSVAAAAAAVVGGAAVVVIVVVMTGCYFVINFNATPPASAVEGQRARKAAALYE